MKLHNSEVNFFCNNKNFVKSESVQLVPDRLLPLFNILFFPYRALVGESESLPPLTKLVASPTMSQSLACIPTSWNEQPDHFLQLSPPPSIPAPPCPQYTVSKNNFGGIVY